MMIQFRLNRLLGGHGYQKKAEACKIKGRDGLRAILATKITFSEPSASGHGAPLNKFARGVREHPGNTVAGLVEHGNPLATQLLF